jgi:hypothetical protein
MFGTDICPDIYEASDDALRSLRKAATPGTGKAKNRGSSGEEHRVR